MREIDINLLFSKSFADIFDLMTSVIKYTWVVIENDLNSWAPRLYGSPLHTVITRGEINYRLSLIVRRAH